MADRMMRILGMHRVADLEADLIRPEDRVLLAAYCAGINAWLDSNSHRPVEFALLRHSPEPWSIADSLGWSKMIAWMLSVNWDSELLRQQLIEKIGPDLAGRLELDASECWPLVMDLPDVLGFDQNLAGRARSWTGPNAGQGVGSNNWVIAGSRTASGKPLLANDMHMQMSIPSVWYENHLAAGELNVTGVSLPGLPMIIAGHNGSVAWGFTAGYADVQDLYEERLHRLPAGGVEYEYRDERFPAEVVLETIRVRGKPDHIQEVIITRHGPIVNLLADAETRPPLALRWTAHATRGGTFHALRAMNRARSCLEFREAMRQWNIPVLNVVYADTEGNIAYTLAGKVPIRAQGDGKLPATGWTGEFEWTGFIPYDELPHLYNPPSGYIATANNRVAGQDFPHWLGEDFVSGDRAERIIELILRQPRIDIAYIQHMQFDQVSPSAQTMAGVIGRLESNDPSLAEVIGRMRAWDGLLAVDRPEAVVYEIFTRHLLWLLLENRLGELMPRYCGAFLNEITGASVWGHHAWEWLRKEVLRRDSPWFEQGDSPVREQLLLLALQQTLDRLRADQGSAVDKWTWGYYHTLTFQHQLGSVSPLDRFFNRGPYPVGGDGHTIWATTSLFDRIESTDGMVGPPFRFIADLSDLNRSLGLMAPGNSGQPGSPHYDDQIDAWFSGQYHSMLFSRDDVLNARETSLELLPG